MHISRGLEDARLNVSETAALINMDAGHFRRLVHRGSFPAAKHTAKGLPYYDYDLLCRIADVMRKRVGLNGEEIMFYRRKPKNRPPLRRRQARPERQHQTVTDPYIESIVEGCRQLGVGEQELNPQAVTAALAVAFNDQRPPLEQAIPVVARHLLTAA